MSKKLSSKESADSMYALNDFKKKYGTRFKASLFVKNTGSFDSQFYKDVQIYIGKGQYTDANMPYIDIENLRNYDCAYVKMRFFESSLVIDIHEDNGIYEIEVVPNGKAD